MVAGFVAKKVVEGGIVATESGFAFGSAGGRVVQVEHGVSGWECRSGVMCRVCRV